MSIIKKPVGALRPADPDAARRAVPFTLPHPERYPFELSLEALASRAALRAAAATRSYAFYLMGDVGGIENPEPQRRVASAMESLSADGRIHQDRGSSCGGTLFTYIVGDIVYNHGERKQYLPQFYAPYRHYQPPIVGVPGNHDGDALPGQRSLDGFLANFCEQEPISSEDAGPYRRPAVNLPNPYWTLEAPWLRIIGLYSNVPEGGSIDDAQRAWFLEQLERPRQGKHLIIAVHQPVFSCDSVHGGSESMFELIARRARAAGCALVVSGHVHNYQRFSHDGVAYIVHGAGGYRDLHAVTPRTRLDTQYPEVWDDTVHSIMRVTVSEEELHCRVLAVAPGFAPTGQPAREIDSISLGHAPW